MGQAGAQREPSMEEILASIRRIIENNDPADAAPADQDHRSKSWMLADGDAA
jgi:cell pole-organizing protein PopZ